MPLTSLLNLGNGKVPAGENRKRDNDRHGPHAKYIAECSADYHEHCRVHVKTELFAEKDRGRDYNALASQQV